MPALRETLARSPRALRDVFRNSNLRLVAISWGSSTTAEGAYLVVLGVFAYEAGGALALGLVGIVRMGPAAAAASFGSLVIDRFPREKVLRAVETMRTALLACIAGATFAAAPTAVIFMLAALHALVSGVGRPSFKSLLPSLATTPGELVAANAASATMEGFGMLVGPALGGVLVATAGAGVGFSAAAGFCLVPAALLAVVRVEGGALRTTTPGRSLGDVVAGFRAIASSKGARLIVGLFTAQTFIRGALNVLIVIVALDLLHLERTWVGWLTAALGAGGLLGALAAAGFAGRRLAAPMLLGLVLWGAPIAAIAALPSATTGLLACAAVGVGNAVLDVAGNTLLQRIVPSDVLGRVFGAFGGLTLAGVGLGSIVTPAIVLAIGTRPALLVTGALLPFLAVLVARRVRAVDQAAVPPERELAFLRLVPMFAALSVAAAEQVASRLIPLRVAAGETLIRQGEEGNRFYIVDEGELEVRRDGRLIAARGHGDYVGEIALLRDVPRTAAVIASVDARVYALERADFLDAVSGHSAGATAGRRVVEERLATLADDHRGPSPEETL